MGSWAKSLKIRFLLLRGLGPGIIPGSATPRWEAGTRWNRRRAGGRIRRWQDAGLGSRLGSVGRTTAGLSRVTECWRLTYCAYRREEDEMDVWSVGGQPGFSARNGLRSARVFQASPAIQAPCPVPLPTAAAVMLESSTAVQPRAPCLSPITLAFHLPTQPPFPTLTPEP